MSLHSSKKIPQQEQLLRTDSPPNCAPNRRVHKASPREVKFRLSSVSLAYGSSPLPTHTFTPVLVWNLFWDFYFFWGGQETGGAGAHLAQAS